MVGVVNEVPLGEQAVDLFRREPLPCFDRGFAGHHVQQRIEQVAAIRLLLRLIELLGQIANQLRQVGLLEHHRIAIDQHRLPAELLHAEP